MVDMMPYFGVLFKYHVTGKPSRSMFLPTASTPRIPRLPTDQERQQIATLLAEEYSLPTLEEQHNLQQLVDTAYVSVWDHYLSDSPTGFVGKVAMVIWPIEPSTYEVLIWRSHQWVAVDQHR